MTGGMTLPPAKKRLGQNFLVDESIAARIIREFGPRPGETIIEIGPGRGALTAKLIEQAGRLVAIEFDRDLAPILRERFGGHANFTLIEGDALTIDFCEALAPTTEMRVIANLPYNISTAILQHLIKQRRCITEMLLMLQREVVARVVAPPSKSERGFLSALVEAYCEAETVFDVAPAAFRPVPKVWNTVVRLRLRPGIAARVENEEILWRIVSAGFAQRRKTIFNNLRSAPGNLHALIERAGGARQIIAAAGIEPARRAETLTLEEWARLSNALESKSHENQ